jgi:hypothetical protein
MISQRRNNGPGHAATLKFQAISTIRIDK